MGLAEREQVTDQGLRWFHLAENRIIFRIFEQNFIRHQKSVQPKRTCITTDRS